MDKREREEEMRRGKRDTVPDREEEGEECEGEGNNYHADFNDEEAPWDVLQGHGQGNSDDQQRYYVVYLS